MRGGALIAFCASACGRFGFETDSVGGGDNAPPIDARPDANVCLSQTFDVPSWSMPNDRPSLPNQASRAASGGRIVDNITGLEWERAISPDAITWDNAIGYCASLDLDGGCWRLPERIELASIINYSLANPSIDPMFGTTPAVDFWSNTKVARNDLNRWVLRFGIGHILDLPATDMARVRCVRGPQTVGATRFVINTDTVEDTTTGLEWQRAVVGSYMWADAQTYCSTLGLAGGGWRSPSIQELETIVDTTVATGVVIDQAAFPSTPASMFWSGNEIQTDANQGWTIDFSAGYSFRPITTLLPTRCVR